MRSSQMNGCGKILVAKKCGIRPSWKHARIDRTHPVLKFRDLKVLGIIFSFLKNPHYSSMRQDC